MSHDRLLLKSHSFHLSSPSLYLGSIVFTAYKHMHLASKKSAILKLIFSWSCVTLTKVRLGFEYDHCKSTRSNDFVDHLT